MTLAEAGATGARTTASAVSCARWVIRSTALVLPVALLARGKPFHRLREAPLARRGLLRVHQPIDVFAPLRGGEALERRARFRVLLQRGDEIGRRFRRRFSPELPRRADARLVERDRRLDRAQDDRVGRQVVERANLAAAHAALGAPGEHALAVTPETLAQQLLAPEAERGVLLECGHVGDRKSVV